MKALRVVFRLGLLIGFGVAMPGVRTTAQTAAPKEAQPAAPGLCKLTGEDEKRAKQLDEQIDNAAKADRWHEAISGAKELLALRARVQGASHFDTVGAEWRFKTLGRISALPKADRAAYLSAIDLNSRAFSLLEGGKFAEAQPLFEQALEIRRRLLGDDHPDTALSYHNLAYNLQGLGKYAEAQPMFEKTMETICRLLGENHPDAAMSLNSLATNLVQQGRYAAAQVHLEKAVEIHRRLLTDYHGDTANSLDNLATVLSMQGKLADAEPLLEKALEIKRWFLGEDHPETAIGYNNLAYNLNAQAKYVIAQPLYEKALEIHHRLLGDDHPYTASAYDNLAHNLGDQAKHAQGQPLLELALAIRRRLLTDDHPDTALSYSNLAANLARQGKHTAAQPLLEKALEVCRRHLSDEHPRTAQVYNNLAANLNSQGKYSDAQPLFEKALRIRRRLLGDDHPLTAFSYSNLAGNLHAQGKYAEARDKWIRGVRSFEASRISTAFSGLERVSAATVGDPFVFLAGVLATLSQPERAWDSLEEDLGRGLLDELAARRDERLAPTERAELEQRLAELERLDRLFETPMAKIDDAERRKRIEDLRQRRDRARVALGELRSRLVVRYGSVAGKVATLAALQSILPSDAAFATWVDIAPIGPNAVDPDGGHWGVVVRSRGIPAWVPIAGTGPNGSWTKDDTELASRVRTNLRLRPGSGPADLRPLVERLRTQRLEPLAKALGTTDDGLPPARRLIVLPSRAMAGIPVEAILADGDTRTVNYAPSATVFKYLREQHQPDRHAGLLALGDPVYEHRVKSSESQPVPDHGLLINVAVRGSNAANHGLRDGDVLLAYNGQALSKKDELKIVAEGDKPVPALVWRDGRSFRQDLAPGELGAMIDSRPAPEAIPAQRKLRQVLVMARSGGEKLAPLSATRHEVEAIAQLFRSLDRSVTVLLGNEASEPKLDGLAAAGGLRKFAFIHLATHGVIDEGIPTRSAVILTQTGLPDPLEQVMHHEPVFDGRLSVREIQRSWDLNADLVTLSACQTALGRESGGEGFVGFTQALLMSGARRVCLSLWRVDDKATSLLMTRFYQNLLGRRPALPKPMPKAEALREAKQWLRSLTINQIDGELAALERGEVRPLAQVKNATSPGAATSPAATGVRPYDHPYFWAPFVLVGDPD